MAPSRTLAPSWLQQPRGGLAVQVAERDGRRADIRGVPGAEQGGADHRGGQGEVGVVPGYVQRGDREQVPEHPPGPFALPVGSQPVTQPLCVETRPGRIEKAHGQRRPGDPQPLGGRQQRVGDQGLAHVQRAGEPGPAQPRLAVRAEHGDVEAVLQRHRAGHPEPGDQLPVGRAAAQEHVLAVVDHQPAPGEGARRPAQPGAGLEQGDPGARLAQRDRGGDAGQAAADHHHVAPGTVLACWLAGYWPASLDGAGLASTGFVGPGLAGARGAGLSGSGLIGALPRSSWTGAARCARTAGQRRSVT